ncbi:MAG: ABC transporter permease [Patescibacteria group bacterium]|nr:ABC transporter permease [Patescibacteria group bacterium]
MRIILRNLLRRKLRTVLTVGGIVIGVFALTVMGAMSEKLSLLVKGGVDYYGTKVMVVDARASLMMGGAPLTMDKQAAIQKVEGVVYASPVVSLMLDEETNVSFGMPSMIVSGDTEATQYETFKIKIARGRDLTADDRGKVALGSDLVKNLKTDVGKTVKLRGKDFEVIGVYDKTLTAPDNSAVVSLRDAQELTYETLPEAFKQSIKPETIVSEFDVYLKDVAQGEEVAKKIQEQVEGVKAFGPSYFKDQIGQSMVIFNMIILSGALIAIIVGGFSIMNTLTFSVIERTREIGIKKAVGARSSRILKEFLIEAGVIGVIGGLAGIGLGVLMTWILNESSRSKGLLLFLVTPRLLIYVLIFSIVISIVAGFFPARRASKLNPVESLRYE